MNEIMNISGIECFEKDGVAYLKLETVARGLGFTTVAASGNEVVRWNTVYKNLEILGVATSCNGSNYREYCPEFIPENIFYRLAMKAKNETAELFQAKIADEVIPSIRKHGAYMTPATLEKVLADPDAAIRILQEMKADRARVKELEAKEEQDRPKVLFADAVSVSNSAILIGDLAKILRQNGVEMGQTRLFQWLRENGYLIKQKGSGYNMPTQRSMELGLFKIKETCVTHSDGHTTLSRTPKVTGKGQVYLVNKILERKIEQPQLKA